MKDHDYIQALAKQQEMLEKVSPKFNELSLDMQEIMQQSKDPVFIGALLFKLVQERTEANKILTRIEDKYDQIMLQLKTKGSEAPTEEKGNFEVLAEQDQQILAVITEKGQVTARDIQEALNYKGVNAASQRLNKLYKEKHLVKVRSGKKVLYLAKA